MKNIIKKIKAGRMLACVVIAALLCAAALAAKASDVFAYTFVKGGAEEEGTVTITAKSGASQANGYSTPGGYRVTYTITKENWTAFDDRSGGFFVVGNQMDIGGGCQFAYHNSGGEIWEAGAVTLGYLRDGRQISRCDVASGTVSCSFDVNSLEEIPEYIAYVYEPASSAYIHINSDMGTNAHAWYYKSLKNVSIIGNNSIDTEGPVLTSSVIPTGATANVGGKTWSTGARIQLRAEDGKSRPGGIRIYKDGKLVHEKDNSGNSTIIETSYNVNKNGNFQADAYDKLNNTSNKITINVSCIDGQNPDISSLEVETTDYVKETKLLAEASDAGCGLHALAYSWNDEDWTDKKEFTVTANGTYTLKVRDALGNESQKTVTVSNIDREGPEITRKITRTGKTATYQGVLWSTEAEISAQAVDDKSGMGKIRIIGNKDKTEAELQNTEGKSTDKLQLEKVKIKNGSYKIWASDMLGNIAVTETFELSHVDGKAPVIKELKTTPLEDGSVLLVVTADDGEDGIGLDNEAYSFDGGKTWQNKPSITIRENGTYKVLVRDRLHQETSKAKQITEVFIKEKTDKGNGDAGNKEVDTGKPDDQDKGASGKTTSGQNIKKATGSNPGRKISVSENDTGNTVVTKKRVIPEKALKDAEEKVLSEISPEADSKGDRTDNKEEQMVRKTILFILAALFAAGCIGLILYLLLFYLRYSCVLYGVEEDQERHRLCRLPLKEKEEEWQVTVPDHKLGLQGTGKYLLVFHPSFVKEETSAFVIIQIDGKVLREKLEEEISINI